MQADAHSHSDACGPAMLCESPLHGCGCGKRIGSTGKGDEKGIALGVHFVAMVLDEQVPQQVSALGQQVGIALPQPLQEARRAFHIAEEQCDGSRREIEHACLLI